MKYTLLVLIISLSSCFTVKDGGYQNITLDHLNWDMLKGETGVQMDDVIVVGDTITIVKVAELTILRHFHNDPNRVTEIKYVIVDVPPKEEP